MKKTTNQELDQINARYFNSHKCNPPSGNASDRTILSKRKRNRLKYGFLLWNPKQKGSFTGSVRDTFKLRPAT